MNSTVQLSWAQRAEQASAERLREFHHGVDLLLADFDELHEYTQQTKNQLDEHAQQSYELAFALYHDAAGMQASLAQLVDGAPPSAAGEPCGDCGTPPDPRLEDVPLPATPTEHSRVSDADGARAAA